MQPEETSDQETKTNDIESPVEVPVESPSVTKQPEPIDELDEIPEETPQETTSELESEALAEPAPTSRKAKQPELKEPATPPKPTEPAPRKPEPKAPTSKKAPAPKPKPKPPFNPESLTLDELRQAHRLYVKRMQKDFSAQGVKKRRQTMELNLREIVDYLSRDNGAPLPRIARHTNITPGTTSKYLRQLIAKGKVRADGWAKTRRYYLK